MRSLKLTLLASLTLIVFALAFSQSFAQELAIAEAEIAVAEAVGSEAEASPSGKSSSQIRPLTVATGLIDDAMITGTLVDSTSVSIRTAFGEASIPLSEVAGIRFPVAEDTSTTVVMLNGDSITGATDLKFVNVETTWGSAKINGQNIATMLFVPGLKWTSMDALGGRRWTLVESTANASVTESSAPKQSSSPVQNASGSRPATNRVQMNSQPLNSQPINRFPFRQ